VEDARACQNKNADTHSADDARDHLARALKRAFPLPDSGTFSDLLDAINAQTSSVR